MNTTTNLRMKMNTNTNKQNWVYKIQASYIILNAKHKEKIQFDIILEITNKMKDNGFNLTSFATLL